MIAVIGIASRLPSTAAADTGAAPKPVLIELFTSEGCSSCPPADNYLQQLDNRQPIPGAQIIALSEHVDYYDHEGWKDPYDSERSTNRQNAYGRVQGSLEPYTPQMLVDGRYDIWTKTPQQMEALLVRAAAAPKIPMHILSASLDRNTGALQAQIDVDGTQLKHNADIYAAVALDHAQSNILRGENTGQILTHVAVAEVLKMVGKLKKGTKVHTQIALKIDPGIASKNLRLIIFAQESGMGKVVGAAMQKNIQ